MGLWKGFLVPGITNNSPQRGHLCTCLDAQLCNLIVLPWLHVLVGCPSKSSLDSCLSEYLLQSRKKSSAFFRQFLPDLASPESIALDAGPLERRAHQAWPRVPLMGRVKTSPSVDLALGPVLAEEKALGLLTHTRECKHRPEIKI